MVTLTITQWSSGQLGIDLSSTIKEESAERALEQKYHKHSLTGILPSEF